LTTLRRSRCIFDRRGLLAGGSAALCVAGCFAGPPAAEESTFEATLLAKPAIPNPTEPFVLVFHQSDLDWHYGLITDGHMDVDAWRFVYQHVGYLAPYALVRLDQREVWRSFHEHLALEAAQSLGRPSGASVGGVPTTPEQEANLQAAYADPIGLSISHFFNDAEDDLGIPGGTGQWRARDVGDVHARLESAYSRSFDMGVGGAMESFTVSFGVTAGDHVFGGQPQILEMRCEHGTSWSVSFVNQGGYRGTNRFVFETDWGKQLASPAMDRWLGGQWHHVSVSVDGSDGGDRVWVKLSVEGLGDATQTMSRPKPGTCQLSIGSSSAKPLSLDDLTITGRVDGRARTLARYTFESLGTDRPAMHRVEDESGNGHTLKAGWGFDFFPTSGADPAVYTRLKTYLVDQMLAAREQAGVTRPEVLTNWTLSEERHRLAAYRPAGFTHGNTVYYLHEPPAGMGRLESIFADAKTAIMTQWAWEDGSPWSTVWIGNVHPERAVLGPEEYQSLISLAVLEGNRYFVVFTAMSEGHLGRAGLRRAEAAKVNAEALYIMAETASWFQGTSSTLRSSRYLGDEPMLEKRNDVIFRARQHDATGELWFAGLATRGPKRARVRLSASRGTLTNLATSEASPVSSSIITIPLDGSADPYYFRPMS
jgi:hypothetical protein